MSKDSILDLNVLAENRDALLLAEAAAWLHMIGKFHESFFLEGGENADLKIPQDIVQNYTKLHEFLQTNLESFLTAGDNTLAFSINDCIENHRNDNSQGKWVRCLVDAHGRGSGTEKGVLKKERYFKQDGKIYLSSPFGADKVIFASDNDKSRDDISYKNSQLYSFLTDQLNLLSSLSSNNWNSHEWIEWRSLLIDTLQSFFDSTVGDTRVPINDVSLWDQTASTVAFFKCEIAKSSLYGWEDPIQKENPNQKPKFRILKIALDGEELITGYSLIGDILSRRNLVQEGFENIKQLVEVEFPLGLEIYRDYNQILFLMPEIADILDFKIGEKSLEANIQEKFDSSFDCFTRLNITISNSASRNVYILGQEMCKPKKSLICPLSKINTIWNIPNDKCTSCQMRPQISGRGYRKLCESCSKRISKRSKKWIQDRCNDTIWIDEVADINGKISLIAASFDLKDWLNGKMISTFRNPTDVNVPTFSELQNELDSPLKNYPKQKTQLGQLNITKKLISKDIINELGFVHNFYNFVVESEDLAEDAYFSLQKNEKLALAVWRKTPSFARVRRVWETTFKFWGEIRKELYGIVNPISLRLIVMAEVEKDLPETGSYKAMSGDISFTIFHTEGNEYIIIENLQRLAKKMSESQGTSSKNVTDACEKICTYLKGKNIKIYDPDGKKRDEPLGSLQISDVIPEDANYMPVIPILVEPSIFMAIVPADKALDISKAIKAKYETEMGKVRNRLPLTLGMVFAKSHTPISSLMDAGRRMLKNNSKEQKWKVKSIEDKDSCDSGYKFRILEFDEGIKWKVPVTMRDGQIQDVWYPYFYIDEKDSKPEEREKSFKGPDGWLVHASDIKEGDKLHILPSTFDFEFLDSSSRRFEICYDKEGKRLDKTKASRPYLLEELDEFDKIWNIVEPKKLNKSQLKKVMYLLETKRTEWPIEENNHVFQNYVFHVLKNATWIDGPTWIDKPEDFDLIVNAAFSGKLKDVIELYMDMSKIGENEQKDNGGI